MGRFESVSRDSYKSRKEGIGLSWADGVKSSKKGSLPRLLQEYNHNTGLFNFRIVSYIGPKLMYVTNIYYLLYQETFCCMSCIETAEKRE